MERLRLAVKKDGALQFLSPLDFARAVRYVIIRAKLPICYSEGFNPHMKLSFASALGVGVSADVEYLDMELAEKLPVPDVMERMNAMSPNGFAVLDGKYVDAKAPKLMAIANYAVYTLRGPLTEDLSQDGLNQILEEWRVWGEIRSWRSSTTRPASSMKKYPIRASTACGPSTSSSTSLKPSTATSKRAMSI